MRLKILSAGVVAGVVAITSAGQGAVMLKYDFTSSNTTPGTVDPNATPAAMAFGTSTRGLSGVGASPGITTDFWPSATLPVATVSRADNTLDQFFVDVKLTANAGFELDMTSFDFDIGAGGAGRTYEVHSSVGGLASDTDILPGAPTDLDTPQGPSAITAIRGASGSAAGGTAPSMQHVDILLGAAYQHLSSLEFRVYFNSATINQNIDLDNITFNGSVAAVPEPASLAGAAIIGLGALARRRNRA